MCSARNLPLGNFKDVQHKIQNLNTNLLGTGGKFATDVVDTSGAP
jgi:hypothetical protein